MASTEKDPPALGFYQWLPQVWLFPKPSSFGLPMTVKYHGSRTRDNSILPAEGGTLTQYHQQGYVEHDLPLFFAGIMSYIFGQNVSVDDISAFLAKCQQNNVLGLLTCVLGIGLYRYIMTRCIATIPLTVNQLILEDAYGRIRPLSLDVCMDFDIFKKFLEVHYQDTIGTVGGALVKAGQFHVMLGSRRGKVLGRSDWRRDLFRPGNRVVNSVYVNKEDAKCLSCPATVMTVTALGEFHCASCQAYYRDCGTFRSSIVPTQTPIVTPPASSRPQLPPLPWSGLPKVVPVLNEEQNLDENDSEEEVDYNVRGLINIDLWIKPQRHKAFMTESQKRPKEFLNLGSEHGSYNGLRLLHKFEVLLQSLSFDGMGVRQHYVARALPTTSEWLFSHEKFAAWIDNSKAAYHHGFLWIKGKPGSGKSTIMKNGLLWAEKASWPQIVLSYFFNFHSPNQLGKSSLGLYRSLLHQLLFARQEIRPLFLARFSFKERDGKVEDWTEIELQNFFIEIITTVGLPPTIVFIDALDEGDEDIRGMVLFLEDLGSYANLSGQSLRICLSSRHYPHISIKKGLSIVIENQPEHGRDIEVYLQTKLYGKIRQMYELQKRVITKSSGNFLWVVLVTMQLNMLYDQGMGLAAIARKLENIPENLDDLLATKYG